MRITQFEEPLGQFRRISLVTFVSGFDLKRLRGKEDRLQFPAEFSDLSLVVLSVSLNHRTTTGLRRRAHLAHDDRRESFNQSRERRGVQEGLARTIDQTVGELMDLLISQPALRGLFSEVAAQIEVRGNR